MKIFNDFIFNNLKILDALLRLALDRFDPLSARPQFDNDLF